MDTTFRKPIPRGSFGSEEGREAPPPDTSVKTVEMYANETRDPNMHSPDFPGVKFQSFADRSPVSIPMPRTAGDQGYLEPYKGLQADPVMIHEDAGMELYPRNARKKELYGSNRDGVVDDKD